MTVYKVKAIKMPRGNTTFVNSLAQIIVQEFKKKFTIWEDPYGDFEAGLNLTYSEVNPSDDPTKCFSTLEEVKELLIKEKAIKEDAEFINIEEEEEHTCPYY